MESLDIQSIEKIYNLPLRICDRTPNTRYIYNKKIVFWTGKTLKCEHGKERCRCIHCDGSLICRHKKEKYLCKYCYDNLFCNHGINKKICKQCDGTRLCEHNKYKHRCNICLENKNTKIKVETTPIKVETTSINENNNYIPGVTNMENYFNNIYKKCQETNNDYIYYPQKKSVITITNPSLFQHENKCLENTELFENTHTELFENNEIIFNWELHNNELINETISKYFILNYDN